MIQTQQQLVRRRKSKINAEQSAFTCFLVYFVVKILFIVTLYKYDNYLKHQPYVWIIFISLALVNTYLILYTGKNPGYQEANIQENELLNFDKNDKTFCSICNCRRKNRSKHCFYCGKCVRKFDHHCPWIGACVGQNNQRMFWLFLLTQTLQSYNAFVICYQSKNLFEYHEAGHFSQQYGVFTVFSIWMLFYIALAGGLLIFHSFLIISNYTTKELFQRNKCSYLQGIKGNPFSQGLFRNILMTIQVQQYGRQWVIDAKTDEQRQRERTFIQKIWSNDYYSCC